MLPLIAWGSYVSALLPLGWLQVVRKRKRKLIPDEFWLVGLAWWLSVGADTQALLDGGSWANTYVWPPFTFMMLALAFVRDIRTLSAIAVVMGVLAWVSVQVGMESPGVIVTAVGSAVVLAAAKGPLLMSMVWYCGVGTVMYVGYVLTTPFYTVALCFWLAYKAATLVAYLLFGRSAWAV